jgi:hypothetical protein
MTTSSPLPCSQNPRHGRSVYVITINGKTERLCAECREKWKLNMEELVQGQTDMIQADAPLLGMVVVGFVTFLMGIGVGLFIPWIVRWGWWG